MSPDRVASYRTARPACVSYLLLLLFLLTAIYDGVESCRRLQKVDSAVVCLYVPVLRHAFLDCGFAYDQLPSRDIDFEETVTGDVGVIEQVNDGDGVGGGGGTSYVSCDRDEFLRDCVRMSESAALPSQL